MFRNLHHDAKLLMASRGIRAFAFSYLNVALAVYLDRLDYSTVPVVRSEERGSAAGATSLHRIAPYAISSTVSTYLMPSVTPALPSFMGGGLQFLNDVVFYLIFRHARPPREIREPLMHRRFQ